MRKDTFDNSNILDSNGQTLAEFLSSYDPKKYPLPSLVADIAVFTFFENRLHILMIRRKNHPEICKWALPGGFTEPAETLEQSAERELTEETGVSSVKLKFFGIFDDPDRDPRNRTVSAGYLALIPHDELNFSAGDDAEKAALFSIDVSAVCDNGKTGKREAQITLRSGDLSFKFTSSVEYDDFSGFRVEAEKGGVAFDHSLLITQALVTLGNMNPCTLARMLHSKAEGAEDENTIKQMLGKLFSPLCAQG